MATVPAHGEYRIKAVVKVLSSAGPGTGVSMTVEGFVHAFGSMADGDVSFSVARK
jgi:hypothetical protein